MSPKWPYPRNALVSLDFSETPTVVDVQDYNTSIRFGGEATVASAPIWGATNLKNREHELLVSCGDNYAAVDGFM